MANNVIDISSMDQFKDKINEAKEAEKIVVIDFTAAWCGPCRVMDPIFAELSNKYPDVIFLKVNADDQESIVQEYNVRAMPTFVFVGTDGDEIDRVVGANTKEVLERKIQLASGAGTSDV